MQPPMWQPNDPTHVKTHPESRKLCEECHKCAPSEESRHISAAEVIFYGFAEGLSDLACSIERHTLVGNVWKY